MALSQDFEARRRERLRLQHQKRERMRKIQRVVFLLAVALLAFLLISSIVRCAKKPSGENPNPVVTQVPYETEKPEESAFGPSVPQPKKGRNNYLDVIKDSGQVKHVYLTFDDGPSKNVTPKILDVLRKYGVKATFFMTGNEIEDYPYLATRAMEEGHLVLPLSKSGNADILYADKTTFMDEVEETYKLICDLSPSSVKPSKIYRFIGGGYENSGYGTDKQRYKDELAKNGYYYCDWNTDIGDSSASRTPEQLVKYFNSYRPMLNNLVIQMYNTDNNSATAEALETIIKKLADEGYIFSRLDQIDFVNEPEEYEDVEETEPESTDPPTEEETKKPQKTDTPSKTEKPKSTSKPQATKKPEATKKPQNATVTQTPAKATLAPTGSNEIETE